MHPSYNTICFNTKNIARQCIFYSAKKRPKIPIFSTLINNENLRNFEGKNHGLVHQILEELLNITSRKNPTVAVQNIKNPAWAVEKQPIERGKHTVHFRCFLHNNIETIKQLGVTQIP